MPGLLILQNEDVHTRKTAAGATAVPRGKLPFLVQTECALVDAIIPERRSGSGNSRWERLFPRAPRNPAMIGATEFSCFGTSARAPRGRLRMAGFSRAPAGDTPPSDARS